MENKNMTVTEFVKQYHKSNDKKALWKAIRLQRYVPYGIKTNASIGVIKDNFQMKHHMILKNTPLLYVLNRMCIVELYCPGIEINTEDALHDYDLLNESGALNEILLEIGQDASEFDTVFQMTYRDFIENTSSPQAYADRIFTTALQMLDTKADSLLGILKDDSIQSIISSLLQNKDTACQK